jgi:hypothetical protein
MILPDDVDESLAVDQPHDAERRLATLPPQLVDRHDRGVLQPGGEARLPLE